MAVAIVIGADGKELARHERDTVHRAFLSAAGGATHTRARRRSVITVVDYAPGTEVRVHEDDEGRGRVEVRKRWDGTGWTDVVDAAAPAEVTGG